MTLLEVFAKDQNKSHTPIIHAYTFHGCFLYLLKSDDNKYQNHVHASGIASIGWMMLPHDEVDRSLNDIA